jgi:hypothetical protein
VFIFLYVHTGSNPCAAQSPTRVHTTNTNAWLMYFGNHKFSDDLGIHAEAQWRRHDFLSDDQQLLLRLGLDYYFTATARLTAGYGFIETHPYGEFAVVKAFPEHRIWQQFQSVQELNKLKLIHRYRLEQRMIGDASTGKLEGGRFENRFRYMAKATFNLSGGEKPLFIALYDEIFINFGRDVGYNLFDQNRLYGALGLTLSDAFKIEAGYLYQVVQLRSLDLAADPRNKIEDNHTFQFALFSNLSFDKK